MTNSACLVRYHNSSHSYDFPDYEKVCSNLKGHENGLLGLWVMIDRPTVGHFGNFLYEVILTGVQRDLPISQLSEWARDNFADCNFYRNKRQRLLKEKVDYLRVVEKDGTSAMGVILNFDNILSFKLISSTLSA